MIGNTLTIRFEASNPAQAATYAESLRDQIREVAAVEGKSQEVQLSTARDDPEAMDAGATLLLTFMSHFAVVALAKGIEHLWETYGVVAVYVQDEDGKTVCLRGRRTDLADYLKREFEARAAERE